MKLATYNDGSRDGQLVVVSRDLGLAHYATGTATRLQQVLDDWNFLSPQLQDLYVTLNQGKARHAFAFDPRLCMAPLPRACQRADGTAYPSHLARLHPAPDGSLSDQPAAALRMAQGGSDHFTGPTAEAFFGTAAWDIDLQAQWAAITGDVDPGASPEQGLDGVRLLLLANDWCLRKLVPAELASGLGLLQSKPATAFAPVAVTPDELGEAWQGGRLHLTVQTSVNGRRLGLIEAGPAMAFHIGQLIAHLAKTRPVRAGSIVGTGTVSSADAAQGFACLAEKRAQEAAEHGAARTPWLQPGDTVRIEVKGRDGLSLFGAIEQVVRTADAPAETALDDAE
jgi:fumarylacetoacetate (FAA) hydrolase